MDERIPLGTRVRYTADPDEIDSYQVNGVEGVVTEDDGTDVVPYTVTLDKPARVYGPFGFETSDIAADYKELEAI